MSETKKYRLSDDTIVMIREMVQLSLLTGISIVDNLRSIVVEEDEESGKLSPVKEYIESYNKMVQDLEAKAIEQAKEADRRNLIKQDSELN